MKIMKSVVAIAGTILGVGIVYEATAIGSQALAADMEYIHQKAIKSEQPKKHWWNHKNKQKKKKK